MTTPRERKLLEALIFHRAFLNAISQVASLNPASYMPVWDNERAEDEILAEFPQFSPRPPKAKSQRKSK